MGEKGFPELGAEFTAWDHGGRADSEAVGLLRHMAVKVRALNAAVSDLEALDSTLWGDVAERFGCTEASVIADLLVTLGLVHDAEMLMTCHYYADDAEEEAEVEMHTDSDGVRDERIRPGILFRDGVAPY